MKILSAGAPVAITECKLEGNSVSLISNTELLNIFRSNLTGNKFPTHVMFLMEKVDDAAMEPVKVKNEEDVETEMD